MKVSIILTNYNYENYIKQSIDSVINQTYQDWELIILDNCSTDGSWEIINSYNDPRITKIRNEVNIGSVENYNKGNDLAKNEIIAILHADDYWFAEKLEKQIPHLEKHDIVFCIPETTVEYFAKTNIDWLAQFYYNGNCLCHSSAIFKKSKVGKNSGKYTQLQDYELWFKALMNGASIYLVEEKLCYYRVHDKNISKPSNKTFLESNLERANILWELKEKLAENPLLLAYESPKDFAGEIFKHWVLCKLESIK